MLLQFYFYFLFYFQGKVIPPSLKCTNGYYNLGNQGPTIKGQPFEIIVLEILEVKPVPYKDFAHAHIVFRMFCCLDVTVYSTNSKDQKIKSGANSVYSTNWKARSEAKLRNSAYSRNRQDRSEKNELDRNEQSRYFQTFYGAHESIPIYSFLNYQRNEDKPKYLFLNYPRNEDEAKYWFLNYGRNEEEAKYLFLNYRRNEDEAKYFFPSY